FRAVMVELFFKDAQVQPGKSLVFAFSHRDDWELFGNPQYVGIFVPAKESPFHVPFMAYVADEPKRTGYTTVGNMMSYWEEGDDPRTIIQHELGHLVLDTFLHDAPGWLHEGIASYLETARFDEKTRRVEVGRMPKNFDDRVRANGLAGIDPL